MSSDASNRAVGCDTSGMITIHRLMRRLFGDAADLVRGVAEGNRQRTEVIANHIAEIAGGLHSHHTTEDTLLWDTLEERSPACALHVGQMKAQHEAIGALLDQLDAALPAWRASASAVDRERVATILDRVHETLEQHLGQEEREILPVASATMSQEEWDELARHGMSSVPRDRLLIQLGMMLESMPVEERSGWFKENVPLLPRLLYLLFGRRQFVNHYRSVYGAAPAG
jgi:hemerythrin-like domain-containing protein